MPDPKSYAFKETLKDGAQVTLRGARADDGPKIQQAFRKLLRETVYTRFFVNKTEIGDTDLKRVTEVDFDRNVALLVTIGSGDEELVIGGASYVLLDADPSDRSAEVAFTVEEDYQRLGVASLLMRHIIRLARDAVRWSPDFGQEAKLGSPVRRTDPDDGQADAVFGGFQGEGGAGGAAG